MTQDATSALLRALQAKLDSSCPPRFDEIVSRSWASVTFVGARHEIAFMLEGDGAEATADAFLANLTEDEYSLRGHVLADIALVSDYRAEGRIRIAIEALTVEDG